jgi:hypothetical protein
MRGGCLSFVISIAIIALVICFVCWIVITDFFIFDILLEIGLIALYVVGIMLGIIFVAYIIKELF